MRDDSPGQGSVSRAALGPAPSRTQEVAAVTAIGRRARGEKASGSHLSETRARGWPFRVSRNSISLRFRGGRGRRHGYRDHRCWQRRRSAGDRVDARRALHPPGPARRRKAWRTHQEDRRPGVDAGRGRAGSGGRRPRSPLYGRGAGGFGTGAARGQDPRRRHQSRRAHRSWRRPGPWVHRTPRPRRLRGKSRRRAWSRR